MDYETGNLPLRHMYKIKALDGIAKVHKRLIKCKVVNFLVAQTGWYIHTCLLVRKHA